MATITPLQSAPLSLPLPPSPARSVKSVLVGPPPDPLTMRYTAAPAALLRFPEARISIFRPAALDSFLRLSEQARSYSSYRVLFWDVTAKDGGDKCYETSL